MSFRYIKKLYRKHPKINIITPIPREKYTTNWLVIVSLTAISALLLVHTINLIPIPTPDTYVIKTLRTEQPRENDPNYWLTLAETNVQNVVISAYNPVPAQTSGDPCIAANGTNICKGMAEGNHYAACNFLSFGTKIIIDTIVYEVVDRTASRFSNRIDIAMPADQIQEAREWGLQFKEVRIISNI